MNLSVNQTYKFQQNLTYPKNVARNIARDSALTHFLLVSDIDLYPSPGLPGKFLEMIARNEPPLDSVNPKIFPLAIFEIGASSRVPWTKTELQGLFKKRKIIELHKNVLRNYPQLPAAQKWMAAHETEGTYFYVYLLCTFHATHLCIHI